MAYTSHLYPDAVVVGETALQVSRQLGGVDVLGQALQARQVGLGGGRGQGRAWDGRFERMF